MSSLAPNESDTSSIGRKRLLFVVTEDWYFCSHRLAHAAAAVRAGYQVGVATRVAQHREEIQNSGIEVIPFEMTRRGFNPARELSTVFRLARVYRAYRPDIVHHVALKPVVYGSIAGALTRVPVTVNAIAGLGYAFTSSTGVARILKFLIATLLPRLLNRKGSRVIVQNSDDQRALVSMRVNQKRIALIRGSGVDPDQFSFKEEIAGNVIVILASRMIWAKGIQAFVDAAKEIKASFPGARFALVGKPDPGNPNAVPVIQLQSWADQGVVEWWGYRKDMVEVLRNCHIVCFPSTYGEGIPKVLIEAAASGRAVVASDIPGCREIVRHGENGYLVSPSDHRALVGALSQLIVDSDLRIRMGRRGREIFEQTFSLGRVIRDTLKLYQEALAE